MKWKTKIVFLIVLIAIALALGNIYSYFFESNFVVTGLASMISFFISYWLILYEK